MRGRQGNDAAWVFGIMISSQLHQEAAHYSVEILRLNEIHRSLGQSLMLG
jgi:hypothetical protein